MTDKRSSTTGSPTVYVTPKKKKFSSPITKTNSQPSSRDSCKKGATFAFRHRRQVRQQDSALRIPRKATRQATNTSGQDKQISTRSESSIKEDNVDQVRLVPSPTSAKIQGTTDGPIGADNSHKPISPKGEHRLHQFDNKMLSGIFIGYALRTGGKCSGDLLTENYNNLENHIAPEVHVKRFKSAEVHVAKVQGTFVLSCADGSIKQGTTSKTRR